MLDTTMNEILQILQTGFIILSTCTSLIALKRASQKPKVIDIVKKINAMQLKTGAQDND